MTFSVPAAQTQDLTLDLARAISFSGPHVPLDICLSPFASLFHIENEFSRLKRLAEVLLNLTSCIQMGWHLQVSDINDKDLLPTLGLNRKS